MKTISMIMAVRIGLAAPLCTIPAAPAFAKDPPRRAAKKVDESEKPPFVGMTKAQALARYGEPKKHTISDEGEQWVYILNTGEVIGKAFIPFNFHATPFRTGTLTFGPNGRVTKFQWDAETNG